jgi:hypothetical protein
MLASIRAITGSGVLSGISDIANVKGSSQGLRKVELYLQALDIEESHLRGGKDRGSAGFAALTGMSAGAYISSFERVAPSGYVRSLVDSVKATTDFSLDYAYRYGLLSRSAYDLWKSRAHYVPQRGWDERDVTGAELGYIEVYGKRSPEVYNALGVKAKGRRSLAASPVQYILSIGASTILSAEKNRYKLKMLEALRRNAGIGKAGGLFLLKHYWYVRKWDGAGGFFYEETDSRPSQSLFDADAAIDAQVSALEAALSGMSDAAAQAGLREQIAALRERKNIVRFDNINPYAQMRSRGEALQHKVIVYDGGERYVMYFKSPQVANALNNNREWEHSGVFLQWLKELTGYFSRMLTQYNPPFALRNFSRDWQLALQTLAAEEGVSFALEFSGRAFGTGKGAILRYITGKADYSYSSDRMLREFFEDGAATGYAFLKDLSDIQKGILRRADPVFFSSLARGTEYATRALGSIFGFLTEYSELMTRFAVYQTARGRGFSRFSATTKAKNVTVNFNRAGASGLIRVFRHTSVFINAGLQGLKRYGTVAVHHPVYMGVNAALYVGVGYLLTLLYGDDPDKERQWSDYERMQNWLIGSFKLPQAQIFRGFNAIGVNGALYARGEKTLSNAVFDGVNAFFSDLTPEMFNPVNIFSFDRERDLLRPNVLGGLRGFVPTFIQPVTDVAMNLNFMGYDIHREPYIRGQEGLLPQFALGKRGDSAFANWLSRFLYGISGGDVSNAKTTGDAVGDAVWLDVNPSDLDYIIGGSFGGFGKFVSGLVSSSYNLIAGVNDTEAGFERVVKRDKRGNALTGADGNVIYELRPVKQYVYDAAGELVYDAAGAPKVSRFALKDTPFAREFVKQYDITKDLRSRFYSVRNIYEYYLNDMKQKGEIVKGSNGRYSYGDIQDSSGLVYAGGGLSERELEVRRGRGSLVVQIRPLMEAVRKGELELGSLDEAQQAFLINYLREWRRLYWGGR